jgi:hypothetical protein
VGAFDGQRAEKFWRALALYVCLLYGDNDHRRALDEATAIDPRERGGVATTKGVL